ncbi:MerR family transcriptional regulator [Catenulispora sp. NF23]|uniref:MerR family transcriptional regulator n=1 Tax=Catenulispora pinistramenti TaxID=2705254 RepID=UPI001BA4BE04|nr:MerR family transcriptional regulator [Catenulispora pinistramenti]MBS2536789.1 MerR family transcriptional regulator [Catenulispora pinistramenti]
MDEEYTVGSAAELAGLSVRTLRYYDEIGLARPSSRSPGGYRLYTETDLAVLQRVAFYRELGLEIGDIAEILGDAEATDEDHLRRQRELIEQRVSRFRAMLALIDKELAARAAGIALTPAERRTVFGEGRFLDRLMDHAEQTRQQWGDTPEHAERQRRTARYGEQDWLRLRTELAAINQALADAMAWGVPATDPAAMELAEQLRLHTDQWFHDCGYESHRELAEHYRANRRSGRNYDEMVPGLSRYVHDAIVANCERAAAATPG